MPLIFNSDPAHLFNGVWPGVWLGRAEFLFDCKFHSVKLEAQRKIGSDIRKLQFGRDAQFGHFSPKREKFRILHNRSDARYKISGTAEILPFLVGRKKWDANFVQLQKRATFSFNVQIPIFSNRLLWF